LETRKRRLLAQAKYLLFTIAAGASDRSAGVGIPD
jgi:hypothetical protein